MGEMMEWRFEEELAADTHRAVTRWWAQRRDVTSAPIPEGLVEALHTARLALDNRLQDRLWDLAGFLKEPQRAVFTSKIAELDPWHILSGRAAQPDWTLLEREAVEEDEQELVAALKERARRRERLERPPLKSATRRRLRDLVRGRGSLAAVLQDDDACRMLRFGAILCDLIEPDSVADTEPDPDEVRALLAELTQADALRAAEAVLNDPLVGRNDRGRPPEREITEFVHAVVDTIYRRVGYRLTSNITRMAARSPNWDDLPGPDVQLILDLLACHAPSKTAEAIAVLIKSV
jgi:hypothetical protein